MSTKRAFDPSLRDALGVLMSAAEVRMLQWQHVARDRDPSDAISELYEAGPAEAEDMALIIQKAMDRVRHFREVIK